MEEGKEGGKTGSGEVGWPVDGEMGGGGGGGKENMEEGKEGIERREEEIRREGLRED